MACLLFNKYQNKNDGKIYFLVKSYVYKQADDVIIIHTDLKSNRSNLVATNYYLFIDLLSHLYGDLFCSEEEEKEKRRMEPKKSWKLSKK